MSLVEADISDRDKKALKLAEPAINLYTTLQTVLYLFGGAAGVFIGLVAFASGQPALMLGEAGVAFGVWQGNRNLELRKRIAFQDAYGQI